MGLRKNNKCCEHWSFIIVSNPAIILSICHYNFWVVLMAILSLSSYFQDFFFLSLCPLYVLAFISFRLAKGFTQAKSEHYGSQTIARNISNFFKTSSKENLTKLYMAGFWMTSFIFHFILFITVSYLSQGGYVFIRVCLAVC